MYEFQVEYGFICQIFVKGPIIFVSSSCLLHQNNWCDVIPAPMSGI